MATLGAAVASIGTPGIAARLTVSNVTLRQIFYTGVDAVGLVSLIGFLMGVTITVQTSLIAPAANGEVLGAILVAVVLRELAPLVTAIVLAGRSGTAIATELGNMQANDEILALASLGIDPPHYVVLPRLMATVVSGLVLTIFFGAVSFIGVYVANRLTIGVAFSALRAGFAQAVRPADLVLFVCKGAGLGMIVGWLCCHYGLGVKSSPTEVPQQASTAVVVTLLACVVFNTAGTLAFYSLYGSPVR